MALDANDLMMLKSMDNSLSPYESFKTNYLQNKNRTSGVGIAGLVTGVAGVVAAVGVGLWASAKANQAREAAHTAKEVAAAQNAGTAALLNRLATQYDNYMAVERQERIAGDLNITTTISDTLSGQQSSALTAQQASELSAINTATNNLFNQAIMGNLSENPQKVVLVSGQRECGCPATNGCGFNG